MNTMKVLFKFRSLHCSKDYLLLNYWKIPCRNVMTAYTKINKIINNDVSITTLPMQQFRQFSSTGTIDDLVDSGTYERVCDETLESLSDYLEELVEDTPHLKNADVAYSSGVLTVNFGIPYGTYVINRQIPNRQIWLSSPTSGPKRYDFVVGKEYWVYKHNNKSLHQLLQEEIKLIVKKDVDFSICSYSLVES